MFNLVQAKNRASKCVTVVTLPTAGNKQLGFFHLWEPFCLSFYFLKNAVVKVWRKMHIICKLCRDVYLNKEVSVHKFTSVLLYGELNGPNSPGKNPICSLYLHSSPLSKQVHLLQVCTKKCNWIPPCTRLGTCPAVHANHCDREE